MTLDFRYALRSLRRSPGFATAVILTLGLGIGANTAIFSVIRAVLLKPLPHKDGERLMYLRQSIAGTGGDNVLFSVPEINDFRGQAKTLGGIAEYSEFQVVLQEDKEAQRINVGLVTGNYFSIMGLGPVLGRLTTSADDGRGVPPVMVLTHDFWQNHFGGDSTIVGKTVRINNQAVQVIGVIQPAPYFPTRMDALMNMVISEHHTSALMVQGRTHRMTEMIARLAPGATVEQARSEVSQIRQRVQAAYPDAYDAASKYTVTLTPFQEVLGQRAKLTLWLLMGAAAFVLIIACANVANLTLMRGVRREQELVVRAALGAGTARLRRLLFAENLHACDCRWGARAGHRVCGASDCSPRSSRGNLPAREKSGLTGWCWDSPCSSPGSSPCCCPSPPSSSRNRASAPGSAVRGSRPPAGSASGSSAVSSSRRSRCRWCS